MSISFETLNHFVGIGTLGMEVVAVFLLATFFLRGKDAFAGGVSKFTARSGLLAGFLLTLAGLVMSLYYSEVLGFAPCGLCWTMRIFLYSQVVLFAVALVKKDRHIADYSIALSLFGIFVGAYQHSLQMGGKNFLPCPASPEAADCAQRILFEFGHITFPWVGVSLFVLLIAIMLHTRIHGNTKEEAGTAVREW